MGYGLITVAAFVHCPDRPRDCFPSKVVMGFRTGQRMGDLMKDGFSDLLLAVEDHQPAAEADDLVSVVALAKTTNRAVELKTPLWTAVSHAIDSVDA